MSFFSQFLTHPLYVIVDEYDDDFEVISETSEIAEVWGLFEDGTTLVRDEKSDPPCLVYVRPLNGDTTLFFSREDAQRAIEKSEVPQ